MQVYKLLLRHGESQASHQQQTVVFRFDTIELTLFDFEKNHLTSSKYFHIKGNRPTGLSVA